MDELVLWLTNGSGDITAYSIVALFALTVVCESISVAIGHLASVGRS